MVGRILGAQLLLSWIYFSGSSADDLDLDEYGRTPLSRNITAILDRLVDKTTYDKRLRPNYGGAPVQVGITIYVSSISAVSEVEMDYTLDIYLRQMWTDRRLTFNETSTDVKSITIDVEYMKSIWVPDTFFPNEKKSLAHTATTHNSFLRITRQGEVTTSQRLTVTASCAMQLELFPLDSQECTLEIESYGYSTVDIMYTWFKGQDSVTREKVFALPQFHVTDLKINSTEIELSTDGYAITDISYNWSNATPVDVDKEVETLPQFQLRNYTTKTRLIQLSTDGYNIDDIHLCWLNGAKNSTDLQPDAKHLPTFDVTSFWGSDRIIHLVTGDYSRLSLKFFFTRNIGFYWLQIYQPSIMVVIISWVAFWINRDSAPARVTLGIMTVLTMTTLMTTTNRQMPKVSYIKAVDIYMGVCYIMVFAALLEYAAVSYSNKKNQDRKKKKQTAQASSAAPKAPAVHPPGSVSGELSQTVVSGTSFGDGRALTAHWNPQQRPPDIIDQGGSHSPQSMAASPDSFVYPRLKLFATTKVNKAGATTKVTDQKLQVVASGIDKYSRIFFPIVFILFNFVYWITFLVKSGKI